MIIYQPSDKDPSMDSEAYCEAVASQEEIYLEETEEELRIILECDNETSPSAKNLKERQDDAARDLLTGDSDDPPLSEETVEEMLLQEAATDLLRISSGLDVFRRSGNVDL
jgi:hypothetical protein